MIDGEEVYLRRAIGVATGCNLDDCEWCFSLAGTAHTTRELSRAKILTLSNFKMVERFSWRRIVSTWAVKFQLTLIHNSSLQVNTSFLHREIVSA